MSHSTITRRGFVKSMGIGAAAALIGARGREGFAAGAASVDDLILSSNENPLGPSKAVIDAVRTSLGAEGDRAGRYPFVRLFQFAETIGKHHGLAQENVFIGCGSVQLLRTATDLFVSESRPLVQPTPTYEECRRQAGILGLPVKEVAVDASLGIDLDALASASKGAGLVFLCNPNNPTGTVHPAGAIRELIEEVLAQSPETTILVDEAYFEYVSLPSHESLIPLAAANPRVLVTRTFSKVYGMAGLRIGYAVGHPETIRKISAWEGFELYTNLPALAGAEAALAQGPAFLEAERKRNDEVRRLTRSFFEGQGIPVTDSHTNFVFVKAGMSAEDFHAACKKEGLLVGRPFPPLTDWSRISFGTKEEMERAIEGFSRVLAGRRRAA
jgi:histidinol-phosphate aminotransferase